MPASQDVFTYTQLNCPIDFFPCPNVTYKSFLFIETRVLFFFQNKTLVIYVELLRKSYEIML